MEEERIAETVREVFGDWEDGKITTPELKQQVIDYAIELYWQTTEGGE